MVKRKSGGVNREELQLQITLEKATNPVLEEAEIREIAEPLLAAEGLEGEWVLEVQFVDNVAMQRLNYQAQGRDEPTDVLSFPVHFATNEADPATILPVTGPKVLGSLVIAPGVAALQAPTHQRTAHEELRFLVDHGIHHLLGYDHDDHAQWLPRQSHQRFQSRNDVIHN